MVEYLSDIGGSEMPFKNIRREDLDEYEGEIPESFDLGCVSMHNGEQYGETQLDDGSYVVFRVTQDGDWVAQQINEAGEDEAIDEKISRDLNFSARFEIAELIDEGLSPAEAIDYHMVERGSFHMSQWAKRRSISHQAVSENIRKAREKLGDE